MVQIRLFNTTLLVQFILRISQLVILVNYIEPVVIVRVVIKTEGM